MHTTTGRLRSDDGTAVLEFAFVAPLLIILVLGMFEAGMAFRARNQLEAAARLAARTDSNLGPTRLADWNSLMALQASLGGLKNIKLNYLIVFRGDPQNVDTTVVPPTCQTLAESAAVKDNPTTDSWGGTVGYGLPASGSAAAAPAVACNIYTRAMLATPPPVASFGGSALPAPTSCANTDWDRFWCPVGTAAPAGRVADLDGNQLHGPDVLGFYTQYTYTSYTNLFKKTVTMNDLVVMRIEPAVK